MLVGGLLCRYLYSGWMYLFVVSGVLGFVWLALWITFTSDSPAKHPTISDHERDYICELTGNTGKKRSMSLAAVPWKRIVTSKPLIALFTTHIANLFGLFFFLTNLGKILTELHRIPTQYVGYILSFGFFLTLVSSLSSGKIVALLTRSTRMSSPRYYGRQTRAEESHDLDDGKEDVQFVDIVCARPMHGVAVLLRSIASSVECCHNPRVSG